MWKCKYCGRNQIYTTVTYTNAEIDRYGEIRRNLFDQYDVEAYYCPGCGAEENTIEELADWQEEA